MAVAPKKTSKKAPPVKAPHQLEPVLRDLVDQVTLIADTIKTKPPAPEPIVPTPIPSPEPEPQATEPPPVIIPPDPPTPVVPPAPCCDQEFCDFLKDAARPLVKSFPTWDPTKPAGSRWEWTPD